MAFLSSRGTVVFLGTTRSELVAAARAGAGADAFWPQAGRIAASTKTAASLKKAVRRDEPQKRRDMVSRLPGTRWWLGWKGKSVGCPAQALRRLRRSDSLSSELLNLHRKLEIRAGIAASPTVHLPARLQEADFRTLAQVQSRRRNASIEPLGK